LAKGDNDSTLAHHKTEYEKVKAQWERSNIMTLMIIWTTPLTSPKEELFLSRLQVLRDHRIHYSNYINFRRPEANGS
jgi:hypothetical protein